MNPALVDRIWEQNFMRLGHVNISLNVKFQSQLLQLDPLKHRATIVSILTAQVPPGTYRAFDEEKRLYFYTEAGETSWTHPYTQQVLANIAISSNADESIPEMKLEEPLVSDEDDNATSDEASDVTTTAPDDPTELAELQKELNRTNQELTLRLGHFNDLPDDVYSFPNDTISPSSQRREKHQDVYSIAEQLDTTLLHDLQLSERVIKLLHEKARVIKSWNSRIIKQRSVINTQARKVTLTLEDAQRREFLFRQLSLADPSVGKGEDVAGHDLLSESLQQALLHEVQYWNEKSKNIAKAGIFAKTICDNFDTLSGYIDKQLRSQESALELEQQLMSTTNVSSKNKSKLLRNIRSKKKLGKRNGSINDTVSLPVTRRSKIDEEKHAGHGGGGSITTSTSHVSSWPLSVQQLLDQLELIVDMADLFQKQLPAIVNNDKKETSAMRRKVRTAIRNNISQSTQIIEHIQTDVDVNHGRIKDAKMNEEKIRNELIALLQPLEVCQRRFVLTVQKEKQDQWLNARDIRQTLQEELDSMQHAIVQLKKSLIDVRNDIGFLVQLEGKLQAQQDYERNQIQFWEEYLHDGGVPVKSSV